MQIYCGFWLLIVEFPGRRENSSDVGMGVVGVVGEVGGGSSVGDGALTSAIRAIRLIRLARTAAFALPCYLYCVILHANYMPSVA